MDTGKPWTVKPSDLQRGILPRLIPCVMAMPSVGKAERALMQKSEKRQRTKIINFRVLPEEFNLFQQRCQASGLSKSDYFRKKCLEEKALRKRKAPNVEIEVLLKTLAQIGKVGGNLNQIARELNMGYLPITDELQLTLHHIRQLRLEIRKALGYGD
ncbi:hypothetical protein BFP97_17865 [Roseivirga sp. 4D4]|uniref:plasmid mobilization protein n=1 Tax=Roseivirga sp. 4D4 TaxID=1889784 RepID=UPI000852F8D2|nr:plasmid mobilization relaxosome protein MobC [Roseivirga sp. 4D4]OEK03277.1 hypothetical protein BFP97_17865 [Roseivirga sp. 4D4]